jgi:hypothetical protein
MRWKPVPLPVASPAGQPALRPSVMHSSRVCSFLGALAAEAQLGMHVEAERRLRAAHVAGLVELDRLVGVLQHPRRIDPEAFVQRVLDGLHAAVEHAQVRLGDRRREPQLVADQADDRGKIARTVRHRIGDQRPEADVVAADRKQEHVDCALAVLRRAPLLGEHLLADAGRAR